MSGDISRETMGDATEGVPWQIIYTAFLGVTLCAFGFYAGMYILHAASGWMRLWCGIAVLVISLGVATSFVALLTGAGWALAVCRVFLIVTVLALAAELVYAVAVFLRLPERTASDAKIWRLALQTVLEPAVLSSLVALALTAAMTCSLFRPTAKRFFSR